MTDLKDENQKTRIPYEPPRLFDLGGGVAYAQAAVCNPGGSPTGQCKSGSAAATGRCSTGTVAGGGNCQDGGIPSLSCAAGGSK